MLEQVETHFKNRLKSLSKDLFLEHGWQLPDGYKENGWKNPLNFTLAEWQQATPVASPEPWRNLSIEPHSAIQPLRRLTTRGRLRLSLHPSSKGRSSPLDT